MKISNIYKVKDILSLNKQTKKTAKKRTKCLTFPSPNHRVYKDGKKETKNKHIPSQETRKTAIQIQRIFAKS